MMLGATFVALVAWRVPGLAIGFFSSMGLLCASAWIWGMRQHRRWMLSERERLGLCLSCGFDLRRTEGQCPECGASVSNADRKHMWVEFIATEAGAVDGIGFVKAWLSNARTRHQLSFERSTSPINDDQIYIVFDLEPHTSPGKITAFNLSRSLLHIELAGCFHDRFEKFDVPLHVTDQEWEELARGMEIILHGSAATVSIEPQGYRI
jgi:hypothetical protein